jgi:hypothetical protein
LSESIQLVFGVAVMVAVFILTRYLVGWRMKRAAFRVMGDLERNQATTPESAMDLPYAKTNILKMGVRDFRKKALEQLVMLGAVGRTEDDRYFLNKDAGWGLPQGRANEGENR